MISRPAWLVKTPVQRHQDEKEKYAELNAFSAG
jgi:hypothetical protein